MTEPIGKVADDIRKKFEEHDARREEQETRAPATRSTFVTPYIPLSAHLEIKAWKRNGGRVFVSALEQSPNVRCRNCQDLGEIQIKFCRGTIYKSHPGGLATYSDSEGAPPGWYAIEMSKGYACKCQEGETRK